MEKNSRHTREENYGFGKTPEEVGTIKPSPYTLRGYKVTGCCGERMRSLNANASTLGGNSSPEPIPSAGTWARSRATADGGDTRGMGGTPFECGDGGDDVFPEEVWWPQSQVEEAALRLAAGEHVHVPAPRGSGDPPRF